MKARGRDTGDGIRRNGVAETESGSLTSKSMDVRSTYAAVELKVLIEPMREQVQNIA